jgi:hypothetical protein
VRGKKRKQKVDQIAAALILQNYLDCSGGKSNPLFSVSSVSPWREIGIRFNRDKTTMIIQSFHRFTLAMGIFAGLVLLLAACSKAPEPPTQEERIFKDPEIRKEGGKTIIADTNMSGVEIVLGATDALPEGFPDDLPLPPECTVNNVVRARDNVIIASFHSPGKLEEVKDFFLKESHFQEAGWEYKDAHETPGGYSIELRKDRRRTLISLTASIDPAGTRVGYVTHTR